MAEIVTVVYEKGLLRPLSPLKLNEHQVDHYSDYLGRSPHNYP